MKVLLVGRNSDHDTLSILSFLLEKEGFQFLTLLEGNQPLTTIGTEKIDIVIFWGLGKKNWWIDLVNKIDKPVIYFSSLGTPTPTRENVIVVHSQAELESTFQALTL
jgi:hypothetical protein